MKKPTFLKGILLLLTLICCNIEVVLAHEAIQTNLVIEFNSGTTNNLQEAISRLNDEGTIIITGKITIDENITIPNGITLDVNYGAMFELQEATTFEICGKVTAGLYQIFSDPVEFFEGSVAVVKAEWFGTGDLAVNYALESAGKIPVEITNDIIVRSAILMNSDQSLVFDNSTIFPSRPMSGGAVIKNRHIRDSNITIVGGLIDGSSASSVAYDAILLKGVDNALIQGVVTREVHITASKDSGNFHLINCTNSIIQNVQAHDTWKMGIRIEGGSFITINGGYFTGTHDSGIGAIDSPNMHVNGVYVDNCGTSNASNITMNLQDGIFENSISTNASGTRNGNGLTIGHEGYPAYNSTIRNNLFINNATKGVWLQGSTNADVSIVDNIIVKNGKGSIHSNSAGVTVYYGAKRTLIKCNEIIENIRGVNLSKTSNRTTIIENRIINNDLYGIDNDGLNTKIESNDLSNSINIFNDANFKNLTETNNMKLGSISNDYARIKKLPWLTDLQKKVLNEFLN